MDDDLFADLGKEDEKRQQTRQSGSKRQPRFKRAVSKVTKRDVQEATDTGKYIKHGRYLQRTMRLRQDQVDEMEEWRLYFRVASRAQFERWAIDVALRAMREGEEPPYEEVMTNRLISPLDE